jgi:ADP-heptose:LPS heptosyltransferase
MNRIILGNQGQFGDLCINTVAFKKIKELNPESFLVMSINKKYTEISPIFLNNPFIDSLIVWDQYDGWPNEKDLLLIKNYKNTTLYHPMPPHTNNAWFLNSHQTEEAAFMNGYSGNRFPNGEQCILTKWFDTDKNLNFVAFSPFAGFYSPNNKKMLSIENAQKIVNLIKSKGYNVIQLGGSNEPVLDGVIKENGSFFSSIKTALSCKFYIGTDTGMTWILSAYSHPSLGLYSYEYYTKDYVKNIQPINPNAIYLSEPNVNQITIEQIEESIKNF